MNDNNTEQLTTCLGHTITVFKNDYIGRKIRTVGLYERENLEFFIELLGNIEAPIVLDIGANIGNHTLAFSTAASKVYCFEPVPAICSILKKNLEDNNITNVVPSQLALSDCCGEETLYMVVSKNVGASSFDKNEGLDVNPVTVIKSTGDKAIAELNPPKVDFIKLDVEAHEAFTLKGLQKTIDTHTPIIAMEWNDEKTIERMREFDILGWLSKSYDFVVIGSNYDRGYWQGKPFSSLKRALTRLFKPKMLKFYTFQSDKVYKNILFLPKGKFSEILSRVSSDA